MSIQSYETTRVPILGLPLGNPGTKCHLDVALANSQKNIIRRGVVLPPKGYGPCQACV
jgi:hypothetical protein